MAKSDWRTSLRETAVVQVKRKKRTPAKAPTGEAGAAPAAAKRRKKRRQSGGVMSVLGVGERRILGGIAAAAADYLKRSKKSASKRRDGAIRDLVANVAKAQERAVSRVAKIPRDLTKSGEAKRATKQVRKAVRRLGG